MSLAQQRILILGGSNGMGLATARRLAQAGGEVVIAGRDQAKLDKAIASIDGRAESIVIDFTDLASLAAASEQLGRIDHLVLAASSNVAWGAFLQTPPDALRRALEGKLIGYWQALQVMLPILRRDGSVVMLTGGGFPHSHSGHGRAGCGEWRDHSDGNDPGQGTGASSRQCLVSGSG